MFYVYKISFKTSGKCYIGMTSKSITERLHKHYTNAVSGIDNKLYRAIRMYGISDCCFETLAICKTQKEALKIEADFITEYNTFNNGYNSSEGGSGGWCVPEEKFKEWSNKVSKRTNGKNNPNHCGVSNEEILIEAISFFKKNGNRLIRARWAEHCKKIGFPQTYTKHRFGGGYSNFIESFKKSLDKNGIFYDEQSFKISKDERYNEEVNRKISETIRKKKC